ncbi:MAG: A24 family peptidase [Actinobacteria bacterium]|nr:A24 family peptidase [Actinomycetota bacterium]
MQQGLIEVFGALTFLLGLSVCDIRTMRIPHRVTLFFLLWELVFTGVGGEFSSKSLWLALLVALLWGVLALALGMGGGDFKLLFPLALFLRSPTELLFMLSLGAALGGGFSLVRRYRLSKAVPFAPFLAVSTLVTLFYQG